MGEPQTQGGHQMNVVFGLLGRWRPWPQTGTSEFAIAGLTLLSPERGGGGGRFLEESQESKTEGPGL